MGFEPMASALALQCSTNSAMKTHMFGADQLNEFISDLYPSMLHVVTVPLRNKRTKTYAKYANAHTRIRVWSCAYTRIAICVYAYIKYTLMLISIYELAYCCFLCNTVVKCCFNGPRNTGIIWAD